MTTSGFFQNILRVLFLLAVAIQAQGAVTDLSNAPLVTSTTSSVKPNLQFILDDSGSMSWDYLPDWANDNSPPTYLFRNNAFNGVAYNPAITYFPPQTYNSDGTVNTTTYPSMTGVSTATGGDGSASSASRNWKAVKYDGYGIQTGATATSNSQYCPDGSTITDSSTTTCNLEGHAYFFTTVAGEYCSDKALRNCTALSAPTTGNPHAASLRWCNSSANAGAASPAANSCQAVWLSGSYTNVRSPAPNTATITVSGASNVQVTHITVNGQEILSATTTSSSTNSTVASRIAANVNACTGGITGQCGTVGYSATSSGSTVTLYAPSNITYTPVITKSGTATITPTAFAAGSSVPGSILTTVITPGVTSYPYPGSAAKASSRSDCAGATCTYAEEMTNYANWWAYYHTRMQMMKTATSIAFDPIGSLYRVGFFTISASSTNSTGTNFLNIGTFDTTQKNTWYSKLFAANPSSSTPLRAALSKAGRIYAGKLGVDPIQYSCQQNFTLLSTDGYWNTNNETSSYGPFKLDGSTNVGNQDGLEPRPYNDGGSTTYTKSTSQIQQSQTQVQQTTNQLTRSTSQITRSTSQTTQSTSQMTQSTSQVTQSTSQTTQSTSQTTQSTSQTTQTNGHLQKRIKSSGVWGAWADTGSTCTASGSVQCQYRWDTAVAVASCSAVAASGGSPYSVISPVTCGTNTTGPTGVASCSPVAASAGNNYTATTCNPVTTGPTAVQSCTNSSASSGNSWTATTCTPVNTGPTLVASCTPATASSSNSWTTTTCNPIPVSGPTPVASCTPVTASSGNNYTATTCAPVNTGPTLVASCTPVAASSANNYTATTCNTVITSGPTGVASCSPIAASSANNYTATTCNTVNTGPTGVSSCTAAGPSSGNSYTTTTCNTVTTGPTAAASCTAQTATSANQYVQTTCTPITISPATPVGSCTAVAASAANGYITTVCSTVTTGPTTVASCTAQTASSTNNWTTTTCSSPSASGGVSDTLADVAEYYYATDLRTPTLNNCTGAVVSPATTGNTLCAAPNPNTGLDDYNNVPTSGADSASWQHMTTFTLGLGASGYMLYSDSYASDGSGDYYDVYHGTTANPTGGICTWGSSGQACNWPTPSSDSQANIDDLWHAAVNGRGTYFSATSPASLASGLSSALASVSARSGASAAATTSNPNLTSGDNYVFSSTFVTQDWTGELVRQQVDTATGAISSVIDWAAQAKLDAKVSTASDSRTIYTYDSAAANHLKSFAYANLSAGEKAYFDTANISSLSQFCATGVTCLSAADQTSATGANLVNYLRGQRGNEGALTSTSKYYRARAHILGDIVNAEAVYVKKPPRKYNDAGYSAFIAANATRQSMVYVAGNDGMLHAFYAEDGASGSGIVGGDEAWAYIPSLVLPNLYKLADKNYANNHQYFTDGTPVVGDVCISSCGTASAVWKTILVGGLNLGGRGYYAMDITDPAAPKMLWEYTETNLGDTYGNPVISKLKDGTWVVMMASGYNNISAGDGVGRLYILNAYTGASIRQISTAVGSTATPSGLARIVAWADNASLDNTTLRVYGGDLLGNLWRFDVNGDIGATGYDAQLLATLKDASGNAQPITTKAALGKVGSNAVVFIGTGRFLGVTDLSDTSQQTFYAIKDQLTAAGYGNPRSTTCASGATANCFVQQTQTNTICTIPPGETIQICSAGEIVRSSTNNPVNFSTGYGWYVNLPDSGERDNTDPALASGAVMFTTNKPGSSACTAGGESYVYYLNYKTGGTVTTAGWAGSTQYASVKVDNSLSTRVVAVTAGNKREVIIRTGAGQNLVKLAPPPSGSSGSAKRVSWRELVTE